MSVTPAATGGVTDLTKGPAYLEKASTRYSLQPVGGVCDRCGSIDRPVTQDLEFPDTNNFYCQECWAAFALETGHSRIEGGFKEAASSNRARNVGGGLSFGSFSRKSRSSAALFYSLSVSPTKTSKRENGQNNTVYTGELDSLVNKVEQILGEGPGSQGCSLGARGPVGSPAGGLVRDAHTSAHSNGGARSCLSRDVNSCDDLNIEVVQQGALVKPSDATGGAPPSLLRSPIKTAGAVRRSERSPRDSARGSPRSRTGRGASKGESKGEPKAAWSNSYQGRAAARLLKSL